MDEKEEKEEKEEEEEQAMTPLDQQVSIFPVCVNCCSVPLPAVLASNIV